MRFIFVTLLAIGIGNMPVTTNVAGTYVLIVGTESMRFQKKLVLRCDATVSTHFTGDMLNDRLDGIWAVVSDTLRITLKPQFDPEGKPIFPHWKETMNFRISKNKLIPIVTPCEAWKNVDQKTLAKLNRLHRKQAFVKNGEISCD